MRIVLTAAVIALAVGRWPAPAAAQDEAETLLQAARAVEARQADAWLRSAEEQLRLTAAQQAAFAAYAGAIRAQAEFRARHRGAGLFVGTAALPPAPDALALQAERLEERAAALRDVQAAAAALYAGLTAQQRTVLDFLAMTPTGTGSADAL